MSDEEIIDEYLDDLLVQLRGSPRAVRRMLAEAEAHLTDAVAAGVDARDAVARFGSARTVAAATNRQQQVPFSIVAWQLVMAAWLLAAVGLVAIGVSGAISGGMDAVLGPRFVAGDLPTITYTATRCSEYRQLAPKATSCLDAAARHHADEVETWRMGAGVLGLLALGALGVVRRRSRTTPVVGSLPPALVPAVGAAVFGVASLALASEAMQSIGWHSTAGLGQWLSACVVSAIVSAAFAVGLLRTLRAPRSVVAAAG